MTTAVANPEPSPAISYEVFAKLDLRVATIVSAEIHPNADKLLKIKLDDGTAEGRQVCAGIRAWYEPSTLVGKQVIIVANLEPKQLRGEISQGMILCATDLKEIAPASDVPAGDSAAKPAPPAQSLGPEGRDVVLLSLTKPVKAGSRVS